MHLPARVRPVCAGACEVYGSQCKSQCKCIRVLCRAVSWSSGMPDDNSEARPLCARRHCSRAAGTWQPTDQQSAQRAQPACCIAPPPCVACPSAFLALVGRLRSRAHAGKRCSAHSFQYSAFPPACRPRRTAPPCGPQVAVRTYIEILLRVVVCAARRPVWGVHGLSVLFCYLLLSYLP